VIRGRVTSPGGAGEAAVTVRIHDLDLGTVTGPDGTYRLSVPADRLPARREVAVTASRVGTTTTRRTLSLARGDSARVDFAVCPSVLNLEGVVVTAVAAEAPSDESVTNVQTAGVDEGGIVKTHGDHLVVLRRGRLFTVRIGDLRPVSVVDAFPPGAAGGGWYDEMLVSGDQVVVIGYSYRGGGTELGIFGIGRDGRLTHRETYHLRSDDYYSSRNYASRLVGTKLVMYTPLDLRADDVEGSLPALRRWHPGAGKDEFRAAVSATRVFRPARTLEAAGDPTLHTVMTCDLARSPLRCEGTAVLGPASRVFYVSPTSVYVWVSERGRGTALSPATVYRIPLDGRAPTALGASGGPVDQFSFLEADGHLNVVVGAAAPGDWMWGTERARGALALMRVPLSMFADGRRAAPGRAYRALPEAAGGRAIQNRFVGRHLLYGTGSGWGRPDGSAGGAVYVVPVAGGGAAEVPLPHAVDRIEPMGGDAVVVGAARGDLHFTGIALDGRPRAAQRYVQRGASQGETRSHGFFYRADGEGSGTLGLPVRGPGRPGYEHLFRESSSVVFLRNHDGRFRPLGELAARAEGAVDDHCVASCVDWYGNSRPLFLRGRVFALMGYEIVEGEVRDGRIREVRRVDYTPRGRVSTR
jgi:hypothetical protein